MYAKNEKLQLYLECIPARLLGCSLALSIRTLPSGYYTLGLQSTSSRVRFTDHREKLLGYRMSIVDRNPIDTATKIYTHRENVVKICAMKVDKKKSPH